MLEVGSSDNHPDLNAKLAGVNAGDRGEVQIHYGGRSPVGGARRKTVDYKFTVKAVKDKKIVPPADDELAKDLGRLRAPPALKRCASGYGRVPARDPARGERRPRGRAVEKASFEVPEPSSSGT